MFLETIPLNAMSRSLQDHTGSRRLSENMVAPDPNGGLSPAELRLLISDFETVVAAGVIRATRREAAQFFSGWLA